MPTPPIDPPQRRTYPISVALILIITSLTLVIGGLCAWVVTTVGQANMEAQKGDHLSHTAQNIAQNLSQAMVEREAMLRSLRDLFENELRQAPASTKRAVMERAVNARHNFSWIGETSSDGRITVGAHGLLEGVNVSGRNWFEAARQSDVFFGNVHPAKLLEQFIANEDGAPLYMLDIALPMRDTQGQVTGVLGSHFNWNTVKDVVQQGLTAAPDDTAMAVAIVANDGQILYDSQASNGHVTLPKEGLKHGRMLELTWPNAHEPSLVVSTPVPALRRFDGLGWQVMVREPSAVVQAGIHRMSTQVMAASALVGGVFALLSVLVLQRMMRPMRLLVQHIQRFGHDGTMPPAHAPSRIAELNVLQTSFVDMAHQVIDQANSLRETQEEIVRTLGRAGEYRDNETGNHVLRMSLCCERLARLAGVSEQDAAMIRLASQMHDVGKIGIPDHILLKPGRFNADERAVMETHCAIGAGILTGMETPLTVMARTIALTHHEKWDGSGYPNGLSGPAIPFEGRITAICDVFDALLSPRPYKTAWTKEKVVALLEEEAGHHFDPALARLFLKHIDEFLAIRSRYLDTHDLPTVAA